MVAKQRGKGEGSIYFEADRDRWRGAIVMPDGSRRRVSGRTAKECREKLRSLQSDVERGLPVAPGKLTVSEFLTDWLERILPVRGRVRSTNTVDNYAWAVRSHIVPALGSKALRTLNTDDVEAMLVGMVRGGLSRNTVMRVRSVLVMALTHGERRGIVPRNVAAIAEMPAEARVTKVGRSLTVEEARQLLRTARGTRIEALVVTALMLGLRPGELCGLRWEDIDLDHATLQVRRSLKRVRGELLLGEPKTRLSY